MQATIRYMNENDREQITTMMQVFYASDAVITNGSEEIFEADFNNCISDSPFLEGYVIECDSTVQGYAMVAKSFSTEFGKPCIWVEDLYIKSEYRGMGLGTMFLKYIEEKYPDSIFRLEVEAENEKALRVYKSCGYKVLPYMEMKK